MKAFIIICRRISADLLLEYLEENKFLYMIQMEIGAVTNARCINSQGSQFESFGFVKNRREELLGKLAIREDIWMCDNIEKVVYHQAPLTLEQVKNNLSSDFYVTGLSFNNA